MGLERGLEVRMRKMGRVKWLAMALAGSLVLQAAAQAQQPIHWETSIDSAKQIAAQSNRLVLVLFTAPAWCGACRALENDMNAQPGIAAAMEANYVPVKLNADFYKTTVAQYGISALPTTLLLAPTPQGEVLDSIRGRLPMDQYLAKLNQVAMDMRRRNTAVVAQIPNAPPRDGNSMAGAARVAPIADRYANASPAPMPQDINRQPPGPEVSGPTSPQPTGPSQGVAMAPPQQQIAMVPQPQPQPGAVPPTVAASPRMPPANIQPPANSPPIGLDGFCPVQLAEKKVWSPGNRRWGAIHRGRTYLFVGPEEQRQFLADPDRYAPVNSGDDVVLAMEQGRSVPGSRSHGLSYGGRVYLFADEATLEKFGKNPRFYAERALQAMRSQMPDGGQVR
jgi:protein disulfide-isomerase